MSVSVPAAANGVYNPNTQKLSKKQLELEWDGMAVTVIQRIAWKLHDSCSLVNTEKELNPNVNYTTFNIYNTDGSLKALRAYNHSIIQSKISPLGQMSLREQKIVSRLTLWIQDVIKYNKHREDTTEGVVAIKALIDAEKIKKVQDSILCRSLALDLIREEYNEHPEYFQIADPKCLVL